VVIFFYQEKDIQANIDFWNISHYNGASILNVFNFPKYCLQRNTYTMCLKNFAVVVNMYKGFYLVIIHREERTDGSPETSVYYQE
jgi:hypothetical protein